MAEHIMTFCKLEDEEYTSPMDRLHWEAKDNRPNKYRILESRYIQVDKNKPFKKSTVEPEPEERWQ
jgi:hypothetical protein